MPVLSVYPASAFLCVAPAAKLPVLLTVVLGIVGYDEDLIGVTVEILVFTDPDEVLQNVVPEQIAEAKADGGCEVPCKTASP